MRVLWVYVSILSFGIAFATTEPPLNNPGPNVVLTNSSQDLKQAHDLFAHSAYKYFHHNKKLNFFKIQKR